MASVIGGVPASKRHGMSFGVNPSLRTSRIISPPPRNGGSSDSSSSRPHSTPIPVGPSILWALKARKSTPSAVTSVGRWGTDWAPSATTTAPAAWATSAMSADRVEGAQHVRHAGHADQLGPVHQGLEVVEDQSTVVVHRYPPDGQSALAGQHVPGDDVGVVLHLGEHDGVARVQVGATPGVGHQVEPLGGVLGEDDLAGGVGGPDEAAHRVPGRLEPPGGLLGDGVDPAVHVGVGGLVVLAHGVEHLDGALGRGGRVQIGDGMSVHLPGQQGEVLAERGHVQPVAGLVQWRHASYPSVSSDSASSGPPSATMTPSTNRWTRSAASSSSMRW